MSVDMETCSLCVAEWPWSRLRDHKNLGLICLDCYPERGNTRGHMRYKYIATNAQTFMEAYNLDYDLDDLLPQVEGEVTMFRAMKGKHGDEWMREWARVCHQTEPLHEGDPGILWCKHEELIAWLKEQVAA